MSKPTQPNLPCFSHTVPRCKKNIFFNKETMGNKKPVSHLCAVVTGANKGIGLSTVRLLAQRHIHVVLTSRNERLGIQAVDMLRKDSGFFNVLYHQLDVCEPASVAKLVEFISQRFGKLDILINNAGVTGVCVDENELKALNIDTELWLSGKAASMIQEVLHQSYDGAVKCLDTNYYGSKRVIEALLPLLQLSDVGARIVNVSSLRSELKRIPNEKTRNELNDIENINEEKLDKILQRFLDDFKENKLEANGWSLMLPAYSISKAVLNAYTRILAKRYPKMYINCVHPGYVKTDGNWNTGVISTEEGSKGPVMLALIPDGGHSGCYFDQTDLADF